MEDAQEADRLAALHDIGLLDAPEDPSLRAIAELAASICGMTMAAVSLIDTDRQVFAGSTGLTMRQTDRDVSFCSVAIRTPERPLLVPDTLADPRFVDNGLVHGELSVRSYAGVPLVLPDGSALGALCVLGHLPYELTAGQLSRLQELAQIASSLLQARRESTRLAQAALEVAEARAGQAALQEQFGAVFDSAVVPMTLVSLAGDFVQANEAFASMIGRSAADLVGTPVRLVTDPADQRKDVQTGVELGAGTRRSVLREKRYLRADGSLVAALVTSSLVDSSVSGEPLLFNTIEPVDQRRAAEAGLMEVQSAYDGIVSMDDDGLVIAWNLGAERLFGWPAAHMVGRRLDMIMPPEQRAAHTAGLARLRGGGTSRMLDTTTLVRAVHSYGQLLDVELSLSSWSQDGRRGYTAVLRDVTELQRTALLTGLLRHAASTANAAESLAQALQEVLAEVCDKLGWVAGQGWTADDPRAVWHVSEHGHGHAVACPLEEMASLGHAPTVEQMPWQRETRHADAAALRGSAIDAALGLCNLGGGTAVPVMAGGASVGMLAFYRPAGTAQPDAQTVDVLEQIGTALGRVVERERTAVLLRHQAGHDPLTDLANRRRLFEALEACRAQLAGGVPSGRTAVVVLDLHRFGAVNASFGHPVGDRLLQEVAARLRLAAPGDLVARLGGDEFVVVTAGITSQQGALAVGQRLLDALNRPFEAAGQPLRVGASAGVCLVAADHAPEAEFAAAVLRDADTALRHAKRLVLDGPALFDAALRENATQRLTDEAELAAAISAGGLEVHYQPVVDLRTGRPMGAEALVRWPRPGHGLVRPDLFIPLAEESGLIVALGSWVLRRACADAAGWARTIPALATAAVSVNVSARQLAHPGFPADVADALARSGLTASRLVLEVTETAVIQDRDAVLRVLSALREEGVRVALDDFGTGYSSLSYVQTLPADVLKIDKSFVDAIKGPAQGTALVEVVIKLAEATGLLTVAEGVETAVQADALRVLGCQRGQGYLWSRPLPIDLLARHLASWTVPAQEPRAPGRFVVSR